VLSTEFLPWALVKFEACVLGEKEALLLAIFSQRGTTAIEDPSVIMTSQTLHTAKEMKLVTYSQAEKRVCLDVLASCLCDKTSDSQLFTRSLSWGLLSLRPCEQDFRVVKVTAKSNQGRKGASL
jgi:hypothetical protein